jgi:DNA-binding NarL/FixJ family response regulator
VCRVVIVDDHTLFREGLRKILETDGGIDVVGDVDDPEVATRLVTETQPDVLLLDIRMPQANGLDYIGVVRAARPQIKILVLTASDDPHDHARAVRLGANGILLKDSARDTLTQAIAAIDAGGLWLDPRTAAGLAGTLSGEVGGGDPDRPLLTEREIVIVRLIAAGRRNREVGTELAISERTVKTHLTHIFRKLGVRDRAGLAMYALRHGLTATPGHPSPTL